MVCIARTVVGRLVISTHCSTFNSKVYAIAVRHDVQSATCAAHLVVAEQSFVYQGIVDVGYINIWCSRGIIIVHNDIA